uniref:ANK_REP_REGION domain-containing protein n=1 Tax=Macrostomum lignano TaxID=282301 RepID=A0A1I8H872_9PLAT
SLLYLAASVGQEAIIQRLLQAQADVNLKAADGDSSLHVAARNGNYHVVKILIEAQADLDIQTKRGATPLYIAAMRGHHEVARLLTSRPNVQQVHGATALYIAVQEGHRKVIESLINAGADVNIKIKSGEGPLHYASQSNLHSLVDILLRAYADPNILQDEGASPLIVACQLGHLGMVERLLSAMADPSVESTAGFTALHLAAQNGHHRIVQILMNAAAETVHKDWQGYSPLYMAAQNGHTRVVQAFIAAQVNVDLQTKYGATPLYIAAGKGKNDMVKLLLGAQANMDIKRHMTSDSPLYIASQMNNSRVVETLVKFQADLSSQISNGFTPLHIAAQEGHQKVVNVLLRAGANASLRDFNGFSPLYFSAQNGHRKVVDALVTQANADVNIQGFDGETALHAASQLGHHGIVQVLIKALSDPDVQQLHGCTAIYLAVQNGHSKAVDVLIEAQADANIQPSKCSPPLYSAILKNYREMVENLIIKSRVDVNQQRIDGIGDSPLYLAVESDNRNWAIRMLLHAQADVNLQTSRLGWSPLHLASHEGCLKAVKALVAAQADVDLATLSGESPIALAIRQGHNQVIEELNKAEATTFPKVPLIHELQPATEVTGQVLQESVSDPSDSDLSRRLHSSLVKSGFVHSRATLQSAVSDVLQQILRQRGVRLSQEYMFIVGSYSEGWGNSLTCFDGKPDVESDIDMMQLFVGRKYHLKGSCQCKSVPDSENFVQYENGHILCSGFASSPARASIGSILAQRPAVDQVSACELCSYPPVLPLQPARLVKSNIPERTLRSLQAALQSPDFPCHVVHAAPPGQGGEQLRVSTTFLENRLLRSLSTIQGQVFVTLKYLVKKVIGRRVNGVKAYHAKTLVFRLLDETPAQRWQPDQLVSLVRQALLMLLDGLEKSNLTADNRILTHYFLNDAGLYLKGSDRSSTDSIASVLKDSINRLPELLTEFENSLRLIDPTAGFRFHPFVVLPQLYPHQTPLPDPTAVEYHQIYDVVCEAMLLLSSSAVKDTEFLARLLGRLPDRAAYSTREALRAMAGLKLGYESTAKRILLHSLGHQTGRGIPWSTAASEVTKDEATTEYVWKHLNGCDSAFKFCLRFDRRPVFEFLPKFPRDVFPTFLQQVSVTDYYMNFDALLRCLQFELLATDTTPGAMAWFTDVAKRQSGDADLQEVLTALHFCPDAELLDELVSSHESIVSEAINAGCSEAIREWERFLRIKQSAASIADQVIIEPIHEEQLHTAD